MRYLEFFILVKRFQRLDGEDDQDPTDQDPSNAGQIPGAVVSNFEHHRKNKLKITGLKAAFKRRLERFDDKDGKMFRGMCFVDNFVIMVNNSKF